MKRLIILPLFLILLVSCGRETVVEHPNFIGTWIGSDATFRSYTIDIFQNGDAYYLREGIGYVEREGTFKVLSDGEKVKVAGKKMVVNKYPAEDDNGNWTMQLDDIQLEAIN